MVNPPVQTYLLDTNVIIQLLRSGAHLDKITQLGKGSAYISMITYYEMCVGIEKSKTQGIKAKKFEKLNALLGLFDILGFDNKAAEHAAQVRATLEKKGESIGPMDTLIAGIAKANKCVLVSVNTREFQRVDGLMLENWED